MEITGGTPLSHVGFYVSHAWNQKIMMSKNNALSRPTRQHEKFKYFSPSHYKRRTDRSMDLVAYIHSKWEETCAFEYTQSKSTFVQENLVSYDSCSRLFHYSFLIGQVGTIREIGLCFQILLWKALLFQILFHCWFFSHGKTK